MPVEFNPSALEAFRRHVEAEYIAGPWEACGLLIDVAGVQTYVPCRNISGEPGKSFTIHPADYRDAAGQGTVLAVCHSHPNSTAAPSDSDRTACFASKLPWYIAAWPNYAVRRLDPMPFEAPLLGRVFVHGVHDCYSLIRDYYRQELGILIPDFHREEGWWADDKRRNLYMKHFADAGFRIVQDLKPHDGVVMQIRSKEPNHGGVYLGDDVLLHHLQDSISRRETYAGFYQRHTRFIMRHRNFA